MVRNTRPRVSLSPRPQRRCGEKEFSGCATRERFLAAEFDAAKARAESLSRMVRSCGDYPLLSGGDINLYSLFVERAMGLIKPDGVVGLLTPSGIYADKTAARFFEVSFNKRTGGQPVRF